MSNTAYLTVSHNIPDGAWASLDLVLARLNDALHKQNTPQFPSATAIKPDPFECYVVTGYEARIGDDLFIRGKPQFVIEDDKGWIDWTY